MDEQVFIYLIFLILFFIGIAYNFRRKKEYIYSAKVTKPRFVLLLIIPLIFISLAYFASDGRLAKYLLAIVASIYVTSPIITEGIDERGIYYTDYGRMSLIIRIAKWENVKDYKLDENEGKLESIKLKTRTIFPDQYYPLEDIDEINKYIKIKIKND